MALSTDVGATATTNAAMCVCMSYVPTIDTYCSSFGVTRLVLHSLQWHVREPVHYGDSLCMQWY